MATLVLSQPSPENNGVYRPTRQIKVAMSCLPEKWDAEDSSFKWFTVGKGKRRYNAWTCGPCGLHYCYHIGEDGRASCWRAVEPGKEVTLHVADDTRIARFLDLPGDSTIILAGTLVSVERGSKYVTGIDPALPNHLESVARVITEVELTNVYGPPVFRSLNEDDLPPKL